MPARLSALLVWALVAGSVVAWGLRLLTRAPSAPAYTVSVGDNVALSGDLTRLFGTTPLAVAPAVPVVDLSARFRLTGVLAPRPPNTQGVALIAVDGKMPRAYPVGSVLDGDMVLQSVALRSVTIGSRGNGPGTTLELPPPPSAATGNLVPVTGIESVPSGQPQLPSMSPARPLANGQRPFVPGVNLGAPAPLPQGNVPPVQPGNLPQTQ